ILALSFPIGVSLNPGEWARISEVFGVPINRVKLYFLLWSAIQALIFLAFLSIEFLRMKRIQVSASSIVKSIVRFLGIAIILLGLIFMDSLTRYLPASV